MFHYLLGFFFGSKGGFGGSRREELVLFIAVAHVDDSKSCFDGNLLDCWIVGWEM